MMGYSHVASGFTAGLALLPVAPVSGVVEQVAWVLMWGGATLLPDLDSVGASASRMWGGLSRLISQGVAAVSGGHRWGTHDLVLGPAVFGGLASLAVLVPGLSVAVMAVSAGLALQGLHVTRMWRLGPAANLLISWIGAWWVVTHDWVAVDWWLPLAIAGGVAVAIMGDWLTIERVPIPLVWLRDRSKRWGLAAFRTGGVVESALIAPGLSVATVLLTGRAVGVI